MTAEEDGQMECCEWIKARRKEMGIRQEDIARMMGMQVSTMSRIEKGYRTIREDELARFEEILGTCDEETRKHTAATKKEQKYLDKDTLKPIKSKSKPSAMKDKEILAEWCRIDCRKCECIEDNACQWGVEMIKRKLLPQMQETKAAEQVKAPDDKMIRKEPIMQTKKGGEKTKAVAVKVTKERTEEEMRKEIRESTREALVKAICLLTGRSKGEITDEAIDLYVAEMRRRLEGNG